MARLLIAEADEALRTMIATAVQTAGHETAVVASGHDAIERLRELEFDCLLIGSPLRLSASDPRGLLEFIEESSKVLARRMIVLTARTFDANLLARAARLRVCAVVSEPFDIHDLLAAVDRCIRDERPPQRFIGFRPEWLQRVAESGLAEW